MLPINLHSVGIILPVSVERDVKYQCTCFGVCHRPLTQLRYAARCDVLTAFLPSIIAKCLLMNLTGAICHLQ